MGTEWERPTGAAVGRISHDEKTPSNIYIDHLVSAIDPADSPHTSAASGSAADNSDSHVIFDGGSAGGSGSISDSQANSGQAGSGKSGSEQPSSKPLAGLRIVIDCANGAASYVAPEAFRRAGAEVSVINAYPDGYNINKEAGSTHPERLQAMVRASDADMGVAFDGDADRCIAVDEDGKLVNGDKIMGILARSYKEQGLLENDTLVVTVMSNLGLKLALRDMGIKTVETAVGDRYVLEEMLRGGYTLGGEQSGHVINRRFSTTGDGTLTALCLANEVMRSGKSLKQLAADFPQLPQTLINVPNVDKAASKTNKAVLEAVEREEHSLGGAGRVLLRPSGTEPLVRVMVEAATQEQSDEVARRLADTVATELKLN
ncbi:MAG: phosphoglucosamine mutase [Bifidobacteriaceae bacterium]|nr:phosphoglucosamine mutase [Bifidobacteriaceae bacterium]